MAVIVAVLVVRLRIKKLKTHGSKPVTTETAVDFLSAQAIDHPEAAALRQKFYQQDLALLKGDIQPDAYLTLFQTEQANDEVSDAAKAKISELEEKLTINEGKLADALQALQKMSRKEAQQVKPSPGTGEKVDEIFRLKCDKVDLQEKINALSMQLDQLIPDKKDQLTTLLLDQVEALKEAAKHSDEVITLLEAKLEALTGTQGASSDEAPLTPDSIPEQAPEDWQAFRAQLQRSLDSLAAKIVSLEKNTETAQDGSDEEEARKLLSVFVQDSQEMMHCITELESENDMLKQQISELQAMVDSGGNIEAATKIKALKAEIETLKSQLDTENS
ncbi:coiled-coil domain-containing protein [Salinibius halmophilus]|uniref:hypothetical protein n=1 Tax=Salinibius halmophilus TaxID=1853216 RepID=UPI001313F4D3|nr:hypothetical protein [Salinibius halmophilus]